VLHFGTLKPFDADAVAAALARSPLVVTVEEHSVVGGLGSAVAEAMAESGLPGKLRRIGLQDTFARAVGSREHLLAHYGIDAGAPPPAGAAARPRPARRRRRAAGAPCPLRPPRRARGARPRASWRRRGRPARARATRP